MKPPAFQTNTARVLRASGLMAAFITRLPLLACFLLAISAKATLPSSDLPNLGPLVNFAEVGDQLDEDPGTINGNVGVFSRGALKLAKPTKININGDIYMATNATITRMADVNGTVFGDQNLSLEQSDVISNSAALAELTPDDTIKKNQTGALSYDVPAGQVEVVDLNGGLNLDNQNVTLTGGGDLVLNIKKSFSLNGSASIVGDPDNIYINYIGTRTISTHAHDTVDALVFDPDAAANLEGVWSGGVFGERKAITLESGATLTEAPEPGAMVLISTGLVCVLLARRFRRLKNNFARKNREN